MKFGTLSAFLMTSGSDRKIRDRLVTVTILSFLNFKVMYRTKIKDEGQFFLSNILTFYKIFSLSCKVA